MIMKISLVTYCFLYTRSRDEEPDSILSWNADVLLVICMWIAYLHLIPIQNGRV